MAPKVSAAVGVFGGTFDPVHFGHLRPALELYERLSLQRMLLVPCNVPPHRPQPHATAEQRLAMLQRAVAGETALEIDRRELDRSGPSYMVDTLASLRQQLGNTPLCLCLGVDAFLGLPGWRRWQELFNLAHIVVAHRPGWQLDASSMGEELEAVVVMRQQNDAATVHTQRAGGVLFQAVTPLAISATEIRKVIRDGGNARYLLPDSVWQYILEQKLYR